MKTDKTRNFISQSSSTCTSKHGTAATFAAFIPGLRCDQMLKHLVQLMPCSSNSLVCIGPSKLSTTLEVTWPCNLQHRVNHQRLIVYVESHRPFDQVGSAPYCWLSHPTRLHPQMKCRQKDRSQTSHWARLPWEASVHLRPPTQQDLLHEGLLHELGRRWWTIWSPRGLPQHGSDHSTSCAIRFNSGLRDEIDHLAELPHHCRDQAPWVHGSRVRHSWDVFWQQGPKQPGFCFLPFGALLLLGGKFKEFSILIYLTVLNRCQIRPAASHIEEME